MNRSTQSFVRNAANNAAKSARPQFAGAAGFEPLEAATTSDGQHAGHRCAAD